MELRVLARTDAPALGRYCHLFARWLQAEEFLANNGAVYEVKSGWRARPQAKIANDLASQLNQLEAKFGLTPSDRSRVRTIEETSVVDNEKAKFFDESVN